METKEIIYASPKSESIYKFLQNEFSDLSRINIQNLISEGYIKLDGNMVKTNYKLKQSNVITIEYKEP